MIIAQLRYIVFYVELNERALPLTTEDGTQLILNALYKIALSPFCSQMPLATDLTSSHLWFDEVSSLIIS